MFLDPDDEVTKTVRAKGFIFIIYRDVPVMMQDVIDQICQYHTVYEHELVMPDRSKPLARWRQETMWLCKKLTRRSLPEIGRRFNRINHTTVIHAIKVIDQAIKEGEPECDHIMDLLPRFPSVVMARLHTRAA